MTKLIQIVNVTKNLGDEVLFKNLSLEFDEGIITSMNIQILRLFLRKDYMILH